MIHNLLNKKLWTYITRLKLLTKPDAPVKFLLDESPFDEHEETNATTKPKDYVVIIGRIQPNSEIFREGSYQIKMQLTPTFPMEPPEVYFITPIYHPNVAKDGKFSHELLSTAFGWTWQRSLVDVVSAVVKRIDFPNIEYAISVDLGREYMENKSEFDRKAMEYVKKYALPRF